MLKGTFDFSLYGYRIDPNTKSMLVFRSQSYFVPWPITLKAYVNVLKGNLTCYGNKFIYTLKHLN